MKKYSFSLEDCTFLDQAYAAINRDYFEDELGECRIQWNSRLRSSAGRFYPGTRRGLWKQPPLIEIALYLKEEDSAVSLLIDTLAHEMIHLWLWQRRKPFGHTPEFKEKMRSMGVSLYNSSPKHKGPKYIYVCPNCKREFPARRRAKDLACRDCCDSFSGGYFDKKYRLQLKTEIIRP